MGELKGVLTVGDVREAIRSLDDDAFVRIEVSLDSDGARVASAIASEIAFDGKDSLGFSSATIKGRIRPTVLLDNPGIKELPKWAEEVQDAS